MKLATPFQDTGGGQGSQETLGRANRAGKSLHKKAFILKRVSYFLRLFLISLTSQFLLGYYHSSAYVQEFWQAAPFHYQTSIDYDIHDQYTDAFNKSLIASSSMESETNLYTTEGKM